MSEKTYKAYLTRRSKWEAIWACQKRDMIGIAALREKMISIGERPIYLDVKWEKRILGDRKLFVHQEGDFFVLTDEADDIDLGKRPEWEGERPGEDWVREAYDLILTQVPHMEPEAISASQLCFGEVWKATASIVVEALDRLRRRGIEKPLGKLFQIAWDEAMQVSLTKAPQVHQVGLWLTVTMGDVDAYTRARAYLGGGARPHDLLGPEDGHGSPLYYPMTTGVEVGEDGTMKSAPFDQSPRGVLEAIRQRLVYRGIMRERS